MTRPDRPDEDFRAVCDALRREGIPEEAADAALWAIVAHLTSADGASVVEVGPAGAPVRRAASIGSGSTLIDVARSLAPSEATPALRASDGRALPGHELDPDLLDALRARVCRALRGSPGAAIGALPLIAPDEPWACVEGPEVPFDREATLWSQLEATSLRTPEAVAVHDREGTLTYGELVARARGVAQRLREAGVRRGDRVGVAAVRTLALPVALFGVLAAGAAYVPLDPGLPVARLREMVQAAEVKLALGERLAPIGLPTLDPLAVPPGGEVEDPPRPDDLCYVIFTSGSTGRPKGVMVPHIAVINRLAWMQRRYPLTPDAVILHKTPAVFDVSVWELFWWASVGASMALLPPGQEMFPAAIASAVDRYGATCVHFIPSLLHLFVEHLRREPAPLASLQRVFSSGEALSSGTVRLFGEVLPATALTNLYGPTEATVDATWYDCPTADPPPRIPIGQPIDNLRAYVIRDGRPVPPGVVGVLHLGGVGVARGYAGAPELTEALFVPEPGRPGERMYATGDLARWLPSGELDFLGRRDLQIKISGMRVELEEIEEVAREHAAVSECAVVAVRPSDNLVRLVAFVVADAAAPSDEIRGFLRSRLPKHMVPSEIRSLERLPRTPTGKIDRRALLALAEAPLGG